VNTVHCSLFTEQRCKQAARDVSDAFARVVSVDASVDYGDAATTPSKVSRNGSKYSVRSAGVTPRISRKIS